jgi:predicted nucleic acid-binding protein
VLAAEAGLLLHAFGVGNIALTAPSFIRYEVAQSLRSAVLRKRISPAEAEGELVSFLSLGIHNDRDGDRLVSSAQRISIDTGVSVYDAMYLAHAEAIGFDLVTADDGLIRRVAGYPLVVHSLADVDDLVQSDV